MKSVVHAVPTAPINETELTSVLTQLGLMDEHPVLVVIGWAAEELDSDTQDLIELLLREEVVPACAAEDAVIVSGGTDVGVMKALGKAVRSQDPESQSVRLLGFAPMKKLRGDGRIADEDAADPEPTHHMIPTSGAKWGEEAPVLVRAAEQIAGNKSVVALAIGGGNGTQQEILRATRRGWPILLLTTGEDGASDQVVRALDLGPPVSGQGPRSSRGKPRKASWLKEERVLGQLSAASLSGRLVASPLDERLQIGRALRWSLSDDVAMKEAWCRFAAMDSVAVCEKRPTSRLALTVIALACVTLVAAIATTLPIITPGARLALKGIVTAAPLLGAVLVGLIERRRRAGPWIDFRAAAESGISEIYRCRAEALKRDHREVGVAASLLMQQLSDVDMRTNGRSVGHGPPAASGAFWPPPGLWSRIPDCDDLLGRLTGDVYDRARVQDQLGHYERSAHALDRRATRMSGAIFALAGVSAFFLSLSWKWSFLAAIGAVAASLGAGLVSWREYNQLDARAAVMFSTCASVRSIRGTWLAHSAGDRESEDSVSSYVKQVEEALAFEGSDWQRGLRQATQGLLDRKG